MIGVTAIGSEFATLEYSSDSGATWHQLPGIQGYTESGGEAPERDVVTFAGVAKKSGHPRVPSIEVSAAYSPVHASWKAIRKASINGMLLQFRFTTKKDPQFTASGAANTIAIADTGVVTFAGTMKPDVVGGMIGLGQVIEVGSDAYVIDSIRGNPIVVTVKPAPETAVTATDSYKIVLPSLRRRFSATVRLAGNTALESEGDMTTTLTLAPRAQLPEWSIV